MFTFWAIAVVLLGSTVDVVSPATCTLRHNKLSRCAIPAQILALTSASTPVPQRVRVIRTTSGNCSTQFALAINVTATGEASVAFPFLGQIEVVVRRRDGAPIAQIELSDGSPWTAQAVFDGTCRVSIMVGGDEPDVDSKADAEGIVTRLIARVAELRDHRDRMEELLLFARGYGFMKEIAENFRVALTSPALADLRASKATLRPALEAMIIDCATLTEAQRIELIHLHSALGALDNPEVWKNPDGSSKTLADLVGPAANDVLALIETLAAKAGDLPGYETQYRNADIALVRGEADLAQARAELSTWLTP